jgi:hypothetical protein
MGWSPLREGTAHEYHQAPDLTYDGTLISGMSFRKLASNDSSASRLSQTDADKRIISASRHKIRRFFAPLPLFAATSS